MLSGKKCLVTGGAGAIGMAIAKELANARATVVSADVTFSGNYLCREKTIESGIIKCFMDVTNGKIVEDVINKYWDLLGGIDVLVNCAGILRCKTFDNLSEDEWNQTIKINLTGAYIVSSLIFKKNEEQQRRGNYKYHFRRGRDRFNFIIC